MSLPTERIGALLTELARCCDVGAALVDADHRYLFVNEALAGMNGVPPERTVGRTLQQVIPDVAAEVRQYLDAALLRGETSTGVTVRAELNGRLGAWLASYHPLELDGQSVVGVVVTDITGQIDAEDRAERRARQQAALAALSRRALAADSLATFFDDVVATLETTLDGERPAILEREPDGRYRLCAGRGWPDGAVGSLRFEHPWAGAGSACGGIMTALGGPAEPWGAVGVLGDCGPTAGAEDAAFLSGVAHLLQVTREQLRASDELRRLADQRAQLVAEALDAADVEREHISEVLHDDALQALLVARQELAGSATDPASLSAARRALDICVVALRRAIGEIHPVVREHAGLGAALRALARGHEDRYGYRARVDVRVPPAGPHDRLVLALARELLTNAGKHAGAADVALTVHRAGDELVLEVTDNGCGIPPGAAASAVEHGHVGLASCLHRAQAAGGSAAIAAREEGGTRAVVRLPL